MKLVNLRTKAYEDVPEDKLATALSSGQYGTDDPAATVPVRGPDGKVGTVPVGQAPQAFAAGARAVTQEDYRAAQLEKKYGGVGGSLAATGEGVARGLTVGLSDPLAIGAAGALGGKDWEERVRLHLADEKDAHPWLAGAGEVAGAVAPLLASGGAAAPEEAAALGAGELAAGAGEAAEVASSGGRFASLLRAVGAPARGVGAAGEAAGKFVAPAIDAIPGAGTALGRVAKAAARGSISAGTEGALYGAGSEVSEDALGDHELTAEKLAAALGHGALYGAMLGGAGSGALTAAGEGARGVLQRIGPKLETQAADQAWRSLNAGKTFAKRADRVGGATAVGRTLLDEGVIPSDPIEAAKLTGQKIAKRVDDAVDAKWESMKPLLANGGTVSAADVGKAVDEVIDEHAKLAGHEGIVNHLQGYKRALLDKLGFTDAASEVEGAAGNAAGESGRTGSAKDYFDSTADRKEAIGEYLDYGYLDANDYMRKGHDAYAAEHGEGAAEQMRDYVGKLNDTLSQAPNTRGTFYRVTSLDPKMVAQLRPGGELSSESPWFVTSNEGAVGKLRDSFADGEGQKVILTIEDHPVSVSEIGRKRPGEALIPAGTSLEVKSVREEGGFLHATLRDASHDAEAARARIGDTAPKVATLDQLMAQRKGLDDLLRWQSTAAPPPELGAMRDIRRKLADLEIKAVDDAAPATGAGADLKRLRTEFARLKVAQEGIEDSVTRNAHTNRTFSLTDTIAGGAAGAGMLAHGNLIGAAASMGTAVVHKLARERGSAIAAAALSRLSKVDMLARASSHVDDTIGAALADFVAHPPKHELVDAHHFPGANDNSTPHERMKAANEAVPPAKVAIGADHADRAIPGLSAHAPKTASALAATVQGGAAYLAAQAPTARGAPSPLRKAPIPSAMDAAAAVRRAHAVDDPVGMIRSALEQGKVHTDAVEAFAKTKPKLYAQLQRQILDTVSQHGEDLTFAQKLVLSKLARTPLDPLLSRKGVAWLQQAYAPGAPTGGPSKPHSGAGAPKRKLAGALSSDTSLTPQAPA